MAMAAASPPPHVALLAFPFASHPNTLHALATLLASAAPHAAFSFLSSASSNASLARLASPANLSLHDVPDGCERLNLAEFRNIDVELVVSLFLKASPANYVEGMRRAERERDGAPVTCIVCDVLLAPLAAEMGLPWVAFRTGGTSALLSHVYTDEIRATIEVGERGDRKLDFIPSLAAYQVSDLPEGLADGDRHLNFSQLLHRMGNQLSGAAAVAVNTCSALEGPIVDDLSAKFSRCFPVGPLNLLLPNHQPNAEASNRGRCLSWLDARKPSSVVYIAFGTIFYLEEPELAAIAEALESTGAPFLWSLKEEVQQRLPRGFLERAAGPEGAGLVVQWAPQAEVLRHVAVGAFVTHCGWKSVVESVAGGVPMVCRPVYGDQRLNARQVVEVWGVGVWAEGAAVAAALQKVLETEEGEAMRERARELGRRARAATADDGSSRRSLRDLVDLVCT